MKKTIQILDYNDNNLIVEEDNFTSRYQAIQDGMVDIVRVVLE